MHIATATFYRLLPMLHGIAYRMLGSITESKDVVLDVWLRWNEADKASISDAEAWLVATTTRVSVDRTRAAKVGKQPYVGIWLPEPVLTERPTTPNEIEEFSREISLAFLTALKRLPPEARVAFLLREVFDMSYGELAKVIGRSEDACRQLVHRSKALLREERPVRRVNSESYQKLMVRSVTRRFRRNT